MPEAPPVGSETEWAAGAQGVDLAGNQPGQSLRRQAELAKLTAPIHSVLARILFVHSAERAWRISSDGEEKVGRSRPGEARPPGRRLARAATCGFPVDVTGVVVPVNADDTVIKTAPVGVQVMNRRRLTRWIRRQAVLLDTTTVDAIYDAARRSTTWLPA